MEIRSNNILIRSKSFMHANEAIVIAHGGYWPFSFTDLGSGKTKTPAFSTVKFNSKHGDFGMISKAGQALNGDVVWYEDIVPPNAPIINYHIFPHNQSHRYAPTMNYDIISVDAERSLSDVFKFLSQEGIHYTSINCFHCRVDFKHAAANQGTSGPL